jgi:hypothetical protein
MLETQPSGKESSMTIRVSFFASFGLAALAVAACGAQPGKEEFVEVCMQKMGGVQDRCTCYVDSVMAAVTPDQFTETARAVVDNRRFSGFIPEAARRDSAVDSAIATATASCLAQG